MANPAQMKSLPPRRESDRERRKRLIILVRILTRILLRSNRFLMLDRTRSIISEFSNRCRKGEWDLNTVPLHEAIEAKLHELVDDETWKQTLLCLGMYMAHRRKQVAPNLSPLQLAVSIQEPFRFPARLNLSVGKKAPI